MANLLSLSNELLIAIYSSGNTIQSAVFFAATSQRLRAIWPVHSDHIIASILKPHIHAVDLAVLEDTWTNVNPSSNTTTLSKCPPRLLWNANLASRATTARAAWIADLEPSNYRKHESFTSPHASYYMMRKLHLARTHPQADLLPGLFETLCVSHENTAITDAEISGWLLCSYSDDEDRIPHSVLKPREEGTVCGENEFEHRGYVILGDWEWVRDSHEAQRLNEISKVFEHKLDTTMSRLAIGMPAAKENIEVLLVAVSPYHIHSSPTSG